MALILTARLIQIQIRPGRAGLVFALVGGVLLVGPFAVSLVARERLGPKGLRVTWLASGVLAMAVGLLSPASFPLILCGALLVAGAVSRRTRSEGAAA